MDRIISSESNLGEKLDIAGKLFPTWTTIVATIISLLFLLAILTRLVYKPVRRSMQERRKYIQNNIDESEKRSFQTDKALNKAHNELLEARERADEIIGFARKEAEQTKLNLLAHAKDEAKRIVEVSRLEMENERLKFEQESKHEVIEIAISAAQKIIEKEVDNESNRKLLDEFIEQKIL